MCNVVFEFFADVTLSVSTLSKLKNSLTTVGIEPATFVLPTTRLSCECRNVIHSNRLDLAAQLVEHTTKPKFVGSISTPVKKFFSFPCVEIYFFTQVTYNLSGYLHTLYTQHANFDHMLSFFC